MNVKFDCIICGNHGRKIVRNNLPMFICDSCGLFWRASFDLPENFYETRNFELEKTGKIDARYTNSIGRIQTLKKYVDLNNLCDVGCGEGVFLKTLNDSGYKNVVGLEPSIEAHDFSVRNKLKIIRGVTENLDKSFFGGNGIHTATMFHVIEHLKDPDGVLKMIYNNLEKGDKLVIETPDTESYILKTSGYKHELIYPEHLHYFNKANLRKLLEKSGFEFVASGNRDFNENNLSIKESLARLGFVKINARKKNAKAEFESKSINVAERGNGRKNGVLRHGARKFLSTIVRLMGRGNYLWIVVKK